MLVYCASRALFVTHANLIPLLRFLSNIILKLKGWTINNQYDPEIKKAVVVGAPHTSNFDFFFGVMALRVLRIKITIIAKHTLFFFPLGSIMRLFGAVPLDRENSKNFVKGTAAIFARSEKLWVGMSPEGTRKRVSKWKTGFYYLALEAKVPIVFAYLDYEKKEMGIGEYIIPTGNLKEDFEKIKTFYSDKSACHRILGFRRDNQYRG